MTQLDVIRIAEDEYAGALFRQDADDRRASVERSRMKGEEPTAEILLKPPEPIRRPVRSRDLGGRVELVGTDAFRRKAIIGYPSSFYPVFVNLVDNAIYWERPKNNFRICGKRVP